MEIRCGTDIIEISRIKQNIEELKESFINKIYTENEIAYCESKKKQKYQHYAARFAAKEAIFKAISKQVKDNNYLNWKEFEILNDENGKPYVNIIGLDNKNIETIDISISHCKEYAIANVVAIVKNENKTEYFDTHAHYEDEAFDKDREEIIKKIYESGVTKCVDVGCSIDTSKKAVELAKNYDFIYAICGIHPSEIENTKEKIDSAIGEIEKIVMKNKKVVAIGEIGLDYHYEGFDKELQQYAFVKQIELANKLNLPIAIHTRDAIDDTIAILRKYKVNKSGILHCCPFNRELVKHGLEQGFYIAFGGTSTFKSSKNACEIVNMVPNDRILIETDCPYLSPEPLRGARNDSRNLKYVTKKLAEYKNCTTEKIAKITYENACKLFKI